MSAPTKKKTNFLKSRDIASINNEIELLHRSTHEFWEEEKVRTRFLEYLAIWSKNPKACFKKTFAVQNKSNMIEKTNEDEEMEVRFVDG